MLKFYPWIGLPFSLLVLASAYYFSSPDKLSASFALAGAVVAIIGVATLARPIIRVGGYKEWYKRTQIIDYGHFVPTPEEIAEDREVARDAAALQLWGPGLIVIGTLINGTSGFLS